MPERIQLKRTKGWRMPSGAVKVDRSTRWGNPFRIGGRDGNNDLIETAADAARTFASWAEDTDLRVEARETLRGKDLACWCPLHDKDGKRMPCHADVLLELANADLQGVQKR